ncbi:MAG: GIY-YIG nuclease family protein [Dermabacter sp.]|nr:GIY-YIG nuclease family protein [Dermabacter sp.]
MTKVVFKRWELEDPSTVAPIFPRCRRGIYVLQFANGDRYVGKATDVVTRYATHRHGSRHHSPWLDIVAIEFYEIPDGDLDGPEREAIRHHRSHHTLRNKTFNFGNSEPSVLDPVVPPEVQRHWATGQPEYNSGSFAVASRREPGPLPRLLTKKRGQEVLPSGRQVWEAVVDELAQVVAHLIPHAVETEARFWSISDYPETAGGRFATLNVGWLELAAFSRRRLEAEVGTLEPSNGLMCFLNAEMGTFIDSNELAEGLPGDEEIQILEEIDGLPVYFERSPAAYSVPVDRISMPLGVFGAEQLSTDERLGARRLAIHAMRTGSARVNARSYSSELTRLVYQRIVER